PPPPDPAPSAADRAPRTPDPALRTPDPGLRTADRGLRILMVTPEAHPFAKTGGLAEVAGALPAALTRLGHSVTVVLPRYRGALPDSTPSRRIDLQLGPNTFSVGFLEQVMDDGVRAVLVDVPALFDREGLYGQDGRDYPDNALRFAVLSRAALEFARMEGVRPDIIHAHDWQTGLVPVYQKMHLSNDPVVGGVPTVFTIHNLAFQGLFGLDALPAIGLDWNVFHPEALEYWGNISLLKGGVNFSEKITTVSPTYAREILTPEFGFGFEGILRRRADDLVGILNGIDTDRWNPEADEFAPRFSASDLAGKREAKRALLDDVGLPADDKSLARPVIGMISRLTDQKGFDLIGAAASQLIELDAAWVMLGSGDRQYEEQWRSLAAHYPDRVSATIGFDERLAHLIEAGADMFLMPSRFEPCGLNQLYSLRYGTVPIVRATGGLEDTIRDAAEPDGNGIKFADPAPGALVAAVRRGLQLYRDGDRWSAIQKAGMAADPSWDVSAREYVKVYGGVRTERR
ncbi:MAG TPA: glycogen synthase GlgA, partial [Vicinamibacterales bacterium]